VDFPRPSQTISTGAIQVNPPFVIILSSIENNAFIHHSLITILAAYINGPAEFVYQILLATDRPPAVCSAAVSTWSVDRIFLGTGFTLIDCRHADS